MKITKHEFDEFWKTLGIIGWEGDGPARKVPGIISASRAASMTKGGHRGPEGVAQRTQTREDHPMTPKGWLANRGGVCYVKILKMGCKYRCKECGAITLVAGPRPKIDPAVPHTPSCQHYPPLRRTDRKSTRLNSSH